MAANMMFLGPTAEFTEVAQVDTFTPGGTIEIGDVFILTATGENGDTASVQFVATAATAANVAAGLVIAWNASTDPLMTPITASGTDTVVLTADVAGVPFNVAATTTEDGGGAADDQTFTRSATTANKGYSDWETQLNWAGGDGDLPGADADDSVFIDGGESANSILYGLDQSGISSALVVLDTTRMQIGQNGGVGQAPYYLKCKSAKYEINKTPGVASPTLQAPVNIDGGSTAATMLVHNSGTNTDATEPGVNLLANSASTVATIKNGNVGIASHNGETATMATVNVEGGNVVMGSGLTLTTLNQKGGVATQRCAVGTVDLTKGTLTHEGTGGITTKITVRGGLFIGNSSGTLVEVDALGGVCDFTQATVAHTITLLKSAAGAVVKLNPARTTVTTWQIYDTAGNLQLTITKI